MAIQDQYRIECLTAIEDDSKCQYALRMAEYTVSMLVIILLGTFRCKVGERNRYSERSTEQPGGMWSPSLRHGGGEYFQQKHERGP